MNKIEMIDTVLRRMENNGSQIEYLEDLRNDCLNVVSYCGTILSAMYEISQTIKKDTEAFLHTKNNDGIQLITGISTCIYLPDFQNKGEYKLKVLGGSKARDADLPIDENTMFDIASITKLFTLILIFKLEELGLINLNDKVSDINPDIQNLEDFTLIDLIRLHGDLRTDGNIRLANNPEEAYEILKTVYLVSNRKDENTYNDFGAIILGDTIAKVVSKALKREFSFSEIMDEFLLKPLNLDKTCFNPSSTNISGTGNFTRVVHDPKSRILGGAVGSAGLFTTSDNLARLAKNLYRINFMDTDLISKKHLSKLGEITFPHSKQSNKGNLGIYVKHSMGLAKTYTPSEFATDSFSYQGWTGAVATFDMRNGIHQNILVNAIYDTDDKELAKNDKPVGYANAFNNYQIQLTKQTMLMYLAKQYYSYLNQNFDMSSKILIK